MKEKRKTEPWPGPVLSPVARHSSNERSLSPRQFPRSYPSRQGEANAGTSGTMSYQPALTTNTLNMHEALVSTIGT